MGGSVGCVEIFVIIGWSKGIQLIDLMNHPSNMEIGLCWYLKGTKNMWTYNLVDPLMIDIETIFTLVFLTYNIDLDAYELHLGVEKIFNNFIDDTSYI